MGISMLLLDNNNNQSYDLDIENDPAVELPIRSLEDKEERLMTEENSQAEDVIDDEDLLQDNEACEVAVEVPSTTQDSF